jgi:hypothetical protein
MILQYRTSSGLQSENRQSMQSGHTPSQVVKGVWCCDLVSALPDFSFSPNARLNVDILYSVQVLEKGRFGYHVSSRPFYGREEASHIHCEP